MSLRAALALPELLVGWVLITSVGEQGHPWPVVGAVTLAAGAYVVGHAVPGAARPWAAAALGAVSLAAVLLGSGPLGDVLAGPLGYANANAALATQAGAALGLLAAARPAWARAVAALGVIAALVTTVLIGAAAASAGVVLLLIAVVAPGRTGLRMSAVLSCVALASASLLPFVVGAVGIGDRGVAALTERRVDLWTDGVDAIPDAPVLGAGAREFATVSPTAAGDSDTREAHAELLQRTVENGLPGGLLEAGAVVVLVVSLLRRVWAGRAGRAAVVCLAALAALWANAGVDYVLAFPAVLGVGFAVVGLASEPPRWRRAGPRHSGSRHRASSKRRSSGT